MVCKHADACPLQDFTWFRGPSNPKSACFFCLAPFLSPFELEEPFAMEVGLLVPFSNFCSRQAFLTGLPAHSPRHRLRHFPISNVHVIVIVAGLVIPSDLGIHLLDAVVILLIVILSGAVMPFSLASCRPRFVITVFRSYFVCVPKPGRTSQLPPNLAEALGLRTRL